MNELCVCVASFEKLAINSVASRMIESKSECNLKRCISCWTKRKHKDEVDFGNLCCIFIGIDGKFLFCFFFFRLSFSYRINFRIRKHCFNGYFLYDYCDFSWQMDIRVVNGSLTLMYPISICSQLTICLTTDFLPKSRSNALE